jgi:amino acid adenylation domain-containing protein
MSGLTAFNADTVAPLSYEQRQVWFLHELMPDPGLDNESRIVAIRGQLDALRLEDSLRAFIKRHEIWRTVFPSVDGQPVQVVQNHGDCEWSVVDLAEFAEAVREKQSLRLAEEEASRPFDLSRGPLIRAMLVRLGEEDHRLVLTLHPMIFDDRSLAGVFLPELRELYSARVHGRADQLGDVRAQYRDYAKWQQNEQHEALASEVSFWREHLRGAPTVLELPTDRARPGSQSYRGAIQEFSLGQDLGAGLRELSRLGRVGLPDTLTAGVATLLHRYTGQEDLLMGLATSGHPRSDRRRAMGCFANVAVLRADLTGEPSTLELLQRIHSASEATRNHGDAPFEAVVQAVQPDRSPGHQPLVQVLLSFEYDAQGTSAADWQITKTDLPYPMAQFGLRLEVDEHSPGLTGRVIYSSDLFERQTIARMIEHWRTILAGMVAEPSLRLGDVQLLTAAETQQLLLAWNAEPATTRGESIEQTIENQAANRAEAIAVVCGGEQLSYGQLNDRANQLARHLKDLGAGAEVAVGVCLERSLDQVVALLAILKAGGTYVPIDPEAPADRIHYVLNDTQMPLLISQQSQRNKLGGTRAQVVDLDRDRGIIGQQGDGGLEEQAAQDQLAYVIYTSGSTGQPKGVMVERAALAAHCQAMISEYGLTPDDSVLQFSQYSFDASLEQILPTLAAGARLVMRGPEIWSPGQLLEELQSQQVSVMNLPPAYWHQVVRQWALAPEDLAGLQLRLVIVGGDRLEAEWVRQWGELGLDGVRLVNAYGPTETTITATLSEAGAEKDRITIGRPLPGRRICILDRRGQPVPAGILGELHVGGALLARGYLNQPELTAQRFVPDPFAEQEGWRLYRTGDLARQLSDGRIEYVGRADQQVKIRGYRIELGEIESALAEHPAVDEAVVVAQPRGEDKELIAYVVGRTGDSLEEELRSYLQRRLPRFMQPAVIKQLDRLPRLATGKPDRRALPPVNRAERRGREAFVPPRLLMEKNLVQIWEDLLAVRPVGTRDNFFDLGGHSLLAAQLVGRIEQMCGQRLRLSTLFARPTVEQLAEVLQAGRAGSPGTAGVLPVQAAGTRRPFFFLHGDWTGGAFYCFGLARACGPEQPFYVLEPCTFSALDGAPTLEVMAAAHIEAMRGVQPAGPYRIGGFCNGGLLAYEMALQLREQGETVEFLALVNPSEPVQFSALRAACALYNKLSRASGSRLADLYLRTRHAQRHLYRLARPGGRRVEDFGKLLVIEPRLKKMFPPRDALYRDYVGVFNWLVPDYRPGIYDSKTTFYWARDEPAIARSWRSVINRMRPSETEEHLVSGDLMSTVTEHAQELAALLSESLNRADEEATSGDQAAG